MNTIVATTYPDSDHEPNHDIRYLQHAAPVAVQILSMIFFAAFAIVSTALAFNWFWPAGFALAVIFALRGFGPFGRDLRSARPAQSVMALRPDAGPAPATVLPSSGNGSFDAYRNAMLDRLESERQTFEEFLGRLREAKDKSEFDNFMDDRARKSADRYSDQGQTSN
jgi:hypothetical protein